MKWFIAMAVGAVSGWLIESVTDEVAIAMAAGAAIGVLATIALFGTDPFRSVVKVGGAMGLGCLAGWVVAYLADGLMFPMAVGAAVGASATIAVAGTRPVHSLLRVVGTMGIGFVIGWGVGFAIGDHRIGMALMVPLGLALLLLTADTVSTHRHRPF